MILVCWALDLWVVGTPYVLQSGYEVFFKIQLKIQFIISHKAIFAALSKVTRPLRLLLSIYWCLICLFIQITQCGSCFAVLLVVELSLIVFRFTLCFQFSSISHFRRNQNYGEWNAICAISVVRRAWWVPVVERWLPRTALNILLWEISSRRKGKQE